MASCPSRRPTMRRCPASGWLTAWSSALRCCRALITSIQTYEQPAHCVIRNGISEQRVELAGVGSWRGRALVWTCQSRYLRAHADILARSSNAAATSREDSRWKARAAWKGWKRAVAVVRPASSVGIDASPRVNTIRWARGMVC